MNKDKEYFELLDELSLISISSASLVKKIEKLLYKSNVMGIEVDALRKKVDELSDTAKDALVDAIKAADVGKVLSILEMSPSTKRGII